METTPDSPAERRPLDDAVAAMKASAVSADQKAARQAAAAAAATGNPDAEMLALVSDFLERVPARSSTPLLAYRMVEHREKGRFPWRKPSSYTQPEDVEIARGWVLDGLRRSVSIQPRWGDTDPDACLVLAIDTEGSIYIATLERMRGKTYVYVEGRGPTGRSANGSDFVFGRLAGGNAGSSIVDALDLKGPHVRTDVFSSPYSHTETPIYGPVDDLYQRISASMAKTLHELARQPAQ